MPSTIRTGQRTRQMLVNRSRDIRAHNKTEYRTGDRKRDKEYVRTEKATGTRTGQRKGQKRRIMDS